MGREIRMVVPNWEHPKEDRYNFQTGRKEPRFKPMYDEPFSGAIDEWITEYLLWKEGKHPDQLSGEASEYPEFTAWHGDPPQSEYYRPNWKTEDMTWFQVYETVSEGTPVTPPFATKDELVNYLVENGDFWDQSRRKRGCTGMNCEPWERSQAERFVHETEWAPTMIVVDGKVMSGTERF